MKKITSLAKHTLLQRGFLSLIIQAQFTAVQLITGIILARFLGPLQFGIYSFAVAIITLLQIIPSSGLENTVIRYSSQYYASQAWSLLKGIWSTSIISSILYGSLTSAILFFTIEAGLLSATSSLSPSVLKIAILSLLFLPLLAFLGAALRASQHNSVTGQLPQYVIKPWAYLISVLIFSYTTSGSLSTEAIMYLQGFSVIVSVIIGSGLLLKALPKQLFSFKAIYENRQWINSMLSFSLLGGLMLINSQTDILMLGFLATPEETGTYKVATTGANLVTLPLVAANLYIAPQITKLYLQNNIKHLQHLLLISARASFSITLLITGIIYFSGTLLIALLFGKEYQDAYVILSILCIGQLVNVASGSNGLVLGMTGHEKNAIQMAAIAAISNIILNLLLIPSMGCNGAAISTVITTSLWNLLMWNTVRQKVKLNTSIFKFTQLGN